MLDDRYAFDGGNIFGGVIDLISELLFEPIVEDGGLNRAYFESERKRRIEMIRAEINNKDRYALSQAARHAFRGTPLGVRDTEEAVSAVTAEYCYATLQRLLCSCPIYISFTGNYTEEKGGFSMTIDELSMTTDGWTETVTMDAWFAYYTEFDMPEIPQYTDLLKADEEAIDEMIAVFEEFITGAFGGMMGEAVPDYGYAY
jgi:hypothetical protein